MFKGILIIKIKKTCINFDIEKSNLLFSFFSKAILVVSGKKHTMPYLNIFFDF